MSQTRLFGTDHLYASDTFIEMQPPSNDPAFLAAMGRVGLRGHAGRDPEAVWVLQGWLFVNNPKFWKPPQGRALLGSVPDDRLLALDLYCEARPPGPTTESFYGKPWIWCIIQNFGGTVSLHGALPRMAADLSSAMTSPQRGRLRGIGLIFEGLDYNPIVQDFVTDMTWRQRSARARCVAAAISSAAATAAPRPRLEAGLATPAPDRLPAGRPRRHAARRAPRPGRPSTGVPGTSGTIPANWSRRLEKLLAAADTLGGLDTYQFDVVNVTRQVLGNLAPHFDEQLRAAIQRTNRAALDRAGRDLLDLAERPR